MYRDFYGFSEEPFDFNLPSRFFHLTEARKKTLDSLSAGITNGKGFMLLTGEKGIGKTTLIRQLVALLGEKMKIVPIYKPGEKTEELLKVILRSVGYPAIEGSKGLLTGKLEDYLAQKSALNEAVVFIVDEAHRLSREVIEDLRLLSGSDMRRPKLLQQILVGDLEFEEMLNSNELRQLQQRITLRCRLDPFTEAESRAYIENRLAVAGKGILDVFTPEASDSICRYGEGVPWKINGLCYLSLSAGYALSRKPVDAGIVEAAYSLIKRQKPSGDRRTQARTVIRRLGESALIMKISYVLLGYSFLAWIVFLFLYLE